MVGEKVVKLVECGECFLSEDVFALLCEVGAGVEGVDGEESCGDGVGEEWFVGGDGGAVFDDGGCGDEVAGFEERVVMVEDVFEVVVGVDGGEVGDDGESVPGEDAVGAVEEFNEVLEVGVEERGVLVAEDDECFAAAVADRCFWGLEAGEEFGEQGRGAVDAGSEVFGGNGFVEELLGDGLGWNGVPPSVGVGL